jgi:uncharacterized glyoxalase superfamily protein PhnB
MAASLAFYRLLGVDFTDFPNEAERIEFGIAEGLSLAFATEESIKRFDQTWTRPSGGHRIALAFALDFPPQVDVLYERAVRAGYRGHREPWDAFGDERYAQVLDPDGNVVSLFSPYRAN